jgi:hypothetical protein
MTAHGHLRGAGRWLTVIGYVVTIVGLLTLVLDGGLVGWTYWNRASVDQAQALALATWAGSAVVLGLLLIAAGSAAIVLVDIRAAARRQAADLRRLRRKLAPRPPRRDERLRPGPPPLTGA